MLRNYAIELVYVNIYYNEILLITLYQYIIVP